MLKRLVAVWLLLAEAGVERGKFSFASLSRVLLATLTMALTNLCAMETVKPSAF